jgi:hypothetical protein
MFSSYEHRNEPLLPVSAFFRRFAKHVAAASGIIVGSLMIGILGYHFLNGLSWVDSLVNASMILGGMGPVDPLKNGAAKVFASFYALYSGMIFLVAAGLIFAPVFHRLLHRFHLDAETEAEKQGG